MPSTTTTPTMGADLKARITEHHGEAVAESTATNIGLGATEKQAFAVAMRDHGATNEAVGEAFGAVFGAVTKPGGAGNVVTAGLRAIGREGEITGAGGGGGTRKVVVRDSRQLLRDEIDRARAALDNVTKPVVEAETKLAEIDADPTSVVNARVAEIDAAVKTLHAEKKTLATDDGAKAYVDHAREVLTTKRDAAKTASDENAERMREAVASLEATLTVIESMTTTDA